MINHRIRKQWKRAMQKRKTAENKAVQEMATRLIGHDRGAMWNGEAIWINGEKVIWSGSITNHRL